MNRRQRSYCQQKVSDLAEQIERLEKVADESLTDGAREFWHSEIRRLSKRRRGFEAMLLGPRPPMRFEPFRR